MGKWFGKLLYAILVIFMTFFIIQSAYDARSNTYLAENMTNEWDNEAQFFKGVNTLLNLDYITSDPIIPAYVDATGEHRLQLQIFGIGYTDAEGNHLDGMMIFINDVVIYEEDAITGFLEVVQNPYIKLTIYTDEPVSATSTDKVIYSGFEGQNFAAGFIFDQQSSEIAYDLTYYVDGSGNYLSSTYEEGREDVQMTASITRIDVDYSNGASNGGELVYQTESLLILSNEAVEDPVFDDSFKYSDFSYDPEDYRLQDDLTSWPVSDAEATTFNLFTERDNLTDYNWSMIRVYLLFAGFVIIVTYLIFFHKHFMNYLKSKHALKKSTSTGENDTVDAKPMEQIFSDNEPKNKDGK